MNYDARENAKLQEEKRHNQEMEAAAHKQAEASMIGGKARRLAAGAAMVTGLGRIAGQNHPDWYDVKRIGLENSYNTSFVVYDSGDKTIAGITRRKASLLVLSMEHMLGKAGSSDVPALILAFKRIFDIARGKNRGALNYTQNDVVAYFFTLMTIACRLAMIQRDIQIYFHPQVKSPITVDQIIYAIHPNTGDISQAIPAIQDTVATCLATLSQFPLPVDLPIFRRWIWLCSHVFKDSNSPDAQFIVPVFEKFHTFKTSDPKYLTAIGPGGNFTGLGTGSIVMHISAINRLLADMMQNTTYSAIAGDIENAFPNLVDWISGFSADEDPYTYDEEFLLQFRNANVQLGIPNLSYSALGLKIGNSGVDQGYWDALGDLHPVPVLRRDTAASLFKSEQVLTKACHEDVTGNYVAMGTRFMVRFQTLSTPAGSTFAYYDESGAAQSYTVPNNQELMIPAAIGTEMIVASRLTLYNPGANAPTQIRVMDSNEIVNIAEWTEVNAFNVYPIQYALVSGSPRWLTKLDSYAVISESAFDRMVASANLAVWGYSQWALRPETKSDTDTGGHSRSDNRKRGHKRDAKTK